MSNDTEENIEFNKNSNTLSMQPLDEFTKEFIKKTRGMNKKKIAFTVWEFGNWEYARGVTCEKDRKKK